MRVDTAKRVAADRFKSGTSRVWIDANSLDQVFESATRSDIKELINRHVIQVEPKKGNSTFRHKKRITQLSKERRRGQGSVRGTKFARFPRKDRWVKTVRALRDELVKLRKQKSIDQKTYRKFYRLIKGGSIKSRAQLNSQIRTMGLMTEAGK
ncbi:MAG: 50S ribosomal protein L19e [Thermoplasmataceae archaeon]